MAGTNKILPFAQSAASTDMLNDDDYSSDAQRLSGNIPGIARQALVNKALKQSAAMSVALAQFAADNSVNVDDTTVGIAAVTAFLETLIVGDLDYADLDLTKVTRTGNQTFTYTGDVRANLPKGKRLRWNGSDTYLCRVFGDPTYANSVTTVTVWFDITTTIPATPTKLERSRLTPQDTANGGALSGSETDANITKLLQSYCCGSYLK